MTDDRKRKTGGEVELLPCPWCGETQSEARVSEGSTFRWRKVDGCCTDGPEVRHDTMADDQAAAEADSHRRAIEAWNTRANVDRALAESRAEVERLAFELDMAQQRIEEATAYTIVHRGALRYCNSTMRDAYSDQTVRAGRAEARAERLAGALREMIELRQATQDGRITERHELEIVRDARAALNLEPTP